LEQIHLADHVLLAQQAQANVAKHHSLYLVAPHESEPPMLLVRHTGQNKYKKGESY
jgi:hypothetical protein